MIYAFYFWPIFCAIANRIRGGWLAAYILKFIPWWSTTPARVFVSLVISVPVFYTHSFNKSLLFMALLYIGFTFRWTPWNIMSKPWRDIPLLSLRGLLLTLPSGLFLDLTPFAWCGISMGLIYFVTWKIIDPAIDHTDSEGYVWNGSDWGELYFGFNLGLFIILSVWNLL